MLRSNNGVVVILQDLEGIINLPKYFNRISRKRLSKKIYKETQMKISTKILMKRISARTLKLRANLQRIRMITILPLKLMMSTYSNLMDLIIHPI